jgi:NADH-quinone oxidoreductase subunit M
MNPVLLLSLIIFLPTIGALLLLAFDRKAEDAMRYFDLIVTGVTFLLTLLLLGQFNPHDPGIQPVFAEGRMLTDYAVEDGQVFVESVDAEGERRQVVLDDVDRGFALTWIDGWNIYYRLGFDGISVPLILLTSFISLLAMMASWSITYAVRGYLILFLLLETGMLGVFLALDFFLFYVFWEVMLLPMYFLIGIWGGPRKEYAAIKFFLYTLVGSVLMLIAILILYFNSDVRELLAVRSPEQLQAIGFTAERLSEIAAAERPVHTFNILAMQQMGQHTNLFSGEGWLGYSLQWWAFVLLFIGFIIKVPSVPFHTWLPDAHVEAPTPISMILAGILLKMGGYGIIRICYPICPQAGYDLAMVVCAIGAFSMVYGAFAAMAQTDFKRLVAYSSVSHMGYVVLGFGVWSAWYGTNYNPDYWMMGMNGAMFQMIAHGISSAGMFFLVGVVYDRVHHRDLNQFGGLFAKMPVYSGLSVGIFFAALGLPGLCGFIGEVLVVLSVWNYSIIMAVIAAFVVILTAGYILWALQRVYLGAEYKGPHPEALTPITIREFSIAAPLLALAVLFGVYPKSLLDYMQPSVDKTVVDLTEWTRAHELTEPDRPATAAIPGDTQADET